MTTATIEREYYQVEMPKVRKAIADFKTEIGIWGKADRMIYLLGKWIEIEGVIDRAYLDLDKLVKADSRYTDRGLIAEGLQPREVERSKIERELNLLEKQIKKREVQTNTPELIEQARHYPIENLIAVKRGMALCPFHGDKNPSMGIKHNRYNCFACGAKGDVIDFVMKTDGVTFMEAIKNLSR